MASKTPTIASEIRETCKLYPVGTMTHFTNGAGKRIAIVVIGAAYYDDAELDSNPGPMIRVPCAYTADGQHYQVSPNRCKLSTVIVPHRNF